MFYTKLTCLRNNVSVRMFSGLPTLEDMATKHCFLVFIPLGNYMQAWKQCFLVRLYTFEKHG
jgi:hypothetical protein